MPIQKERRGKVLKSQTRPSRHLGNNRNRVVLRTVLRCGSKRNRTQNNRLEQRRTGTSIMYKRAGTCPHALSTWPRLCVQPRQGNGSYKCRKLLFSSLWLGTTKKHSRRVREHQTKHYCRILQTFMICIICHPICKIASI